MVLTKENLQEWKSLMNKAMNERHNYGGVYSDTIGDDEWLERYEGRSFEQAINDEILEWDS